MKVIIICPKCKGRGKIPSSLGFISYHRACPRCKGQGRLKHRISEHQRV